MVYVKVSCKENLPTRHLDRSESSPNFVYL